MTPETFRYFADFLFSKSGLSLAEEKKYLLENRLTSVIRKHDIIDVNQLASRVRAQPHGEIAADVVESMSVTETSFFRDRTPFTNFTDVVLPHLIKTRPANHTIKIWSAAASTGQEAYTLAMLCKEKAGVLGGRKVEIRATDISTSVLEKAKAGIYSQFEVQRGMPIQLLLKYFEQKGDFWAIGPEIRQMVDFQPFNLMSPFHGLPQFDVIFCRNVLIYFDIETKSSVLSRMSSVLAPDGFLFLGGAETTVGIDTCFKPSATDRGVFRLAEHVSETALSA